MGWGRAGKPEQDPAPTDYVASEPVKVVLNRYQRRSLARAQRADNRSPQTRAMRRTFRGIITQAEADTLYECAQARK